MSDSRCRAVRRQLTAFLDGELSEQEARRIQGHLEACPDCAKERAALAEVKATYRGALALESTPSDRLAILRAARSGRIAAARRPPLLARLGRPAWVTICALAACALLAQALLMNRRHVEPAGMALSRPVLTLVEYRARQENQPLPADGRLSLGEAQP